MADLISRKALVSKLSKGYWDCELQQAKNDPCVIDAMIDFAIRIVKEMPLESLWQIGTPTEEGWYLLKVKSDDEVIYDTNRLIQCLWGLDWKYVHEEILAWQKIDEEEK